MHAFAYFFASMFLLKQTLKKTFLLLTYRTFSRYTGSKFLWINLQWAICRWSRSELKTINRPNFSRLHRRLMGVIRIWEW